MEFNSNTSHCGVDCTICPVYIATTQNNDNLKYQIALEWSEIYKTEIKKDDINCLGCKSDTLFKLCSKCFYRDCNINKEIKSCLKCKEYPCNRLKKFYNWNRDKKLL